MAKPTYRTGMFCWNELGTTDDAAARNFYTKLIGWGSNESQMPDDMGTYILCTVDGEDVAGMYKMSGEMFEGVPSHWMSYVWCDSVDQIAARVTQLGGTVMNPPMDIPGVGRMAMVADPAGARFSLFQGVDHPGAAQFEGAQPQGVFCWNECMSQDAAKVQSFYTQLFGWSVNEMDMGDMKYTMFMMGEQPMGGLMQTPKEMGDAPSAWNTYITVDDCDAKAKQVTKLGGKVLLEPSDIPGIGRQCGLQDPTGAMISLIKLNPPS